MTTTVSNSDSCCHPLFGRSLSSSGPLKGIDFNSMKRVCNYQWSSLAKEAGRKRWIAHSKGSVASANNRHHSLGWSAVTIELCYYSAGSLAQGSFAAETL